MIGKQGIDRVTVLQQNLDRVKGEIFIDRQGEVRVTGCLDRLWKG